MKNKQILFPLLLSGFLFITNVAKSDTIDFYHVYYNNKLVEQCIMPKEIKINASKIKKQDKLSVDYYNDTPSAEQEVFYIEIVSKAKPYFSQKIYSNLSIDLFLLYKASRVLNSYSYEVYYDTTEHPGIRLLFTLTFT